MRGSLARLTALAAGLALMLCGASCHARPAPSVPDDPAWADWDGTVVFLGDSITDFCDLAYYYPGLNAVNEGISGETTWDILERMERSVYAREPQVVVILAGINDLFLGAGAETVVNDLSAIVQGIAQRLPETEVIVQSLYPVGLELDADGTVTGQVRAVNARLAEMADRYGYRYADVYSAMQTEEGYLEPAYADDGLHPNDAGYQAARPVLTRALNEAIAALDGPA